MHDEVESAIARFLAKLGKLVSFNRQDLLYKDVLIGIKRKQRGRKKQGARAISRWDSARLNGSEGDVTESGVCPDITIRIGRRELVLDVVTVDSGLVSHTSNGQAFQRPIDVLRKAERQKRARYGESVRLRVL